MFEDEYSETTELPSNRLRWTGMTGVVLIFITIGLCIGASAGGRWSGIDETVATPTPVPTEAEFGLAHVTRLINGMFYV
jgi:hypothetical protein